jgi:hypothetical protein
MRNLTVALVVVIAVLGGFYSGWKFSQSKAGANGSPTAALSFATPSPSAATAGNAGNGGFAGGFGGRGTAGQVTAVSGNVITIHNPNTGQDTKVQLSGNTTISKTAAGSTADLQPGVNVTVVGQPGADGTVDASSVSIVPALPAGGNGGRGRPSASPSP